MASCNLLVALTFHLAAYVSDAASPNNRPIIGILTQPLNVELLGGGDVLLGDGNVNRSYIAASYVKFVESAGARAVPLHFESSDAELTTLFNQINGIIFPGGGADTKKKPSNRFREAAELLYGLALKSSDKKNPFPIHGTCLGFQLLNLIAAGDDGVLCTRCYDTEGTPLPLDLTPEWETSQLFSGAPSSLISAVTRQNITENSHSSGVDPKMYKVNAKLRDFFNVLSTNADSHGKVFASTIEAKHYPITATQWHPEKNNFEWGKIGKLGYDAIPHSPEAVLLSQWVANNFVNHARQNSNSFATLKAEQDALIYNTAPVQDPQGYFSQIYLWQNYGPKSRPIIV